MRILVVEDETYIAELLQEALEDMGNSCIVAADTDDADRLLNEHSIDAVTLDLGIPGRGGLEWLDDVARTRPTLARKTLVITGLALEPDSVSRLARHGAGMLAKPFTLESLYEAIRTQLDHGTAAHVRSN